MLQDTASALDVLPKTLLFSVLRMITATDVHTAAETTSSSNLKGEALTGRLHTAPLLAKQDLTTSRPDKHHSHPHDLQR